jgi:hypothetical protein
MEKQTAVEFLIESVMSRGLYTTEMLEEFEQAKEMEKQQIINCYNQSWHFRDKPYETAEKYYNETFGK